MNRPLPNGGIVIKYNANQKYCTDAVSAAKFKDLCDRAGVKYQTFVNRSDVPGGSTLGNISNTQVPMNTVDIGLPQLAMHSPYETAGVEDTEVLSEQRKNFSDKQNRTGIKIKNSDKKQAGEILPLLRDMSNAKLCELYVNVHSLYPDIR